MITQSTRLLAVATLMLAGAAAHAQALYQVKNYTLMWDVTAKHGAVRINADNDRQAEEVIQVQSIAELNSWGHFMNENDVQVRVTGSQRVLLATKKR